MGEWKGGAKGECPAIRELKEALMLGVPLLAADRKKIGTIRGDGSRHTAGLAMDIMLDSRDSVEKSVADQIIDALITVHPQMRWADIIYVDWKGKTPVYFHIPGMPPYGGRKGMLKKNPTDPALGAKHKNHIHIDWWGFNSKDWPPHAKTTGFKTALVAELQKPPKWVTEWLSKAA
ncbi:MAG: hypothetical protein IPJ30_05745 [Acidobacteria bacterium]|nr:hypothetical protein [Acidobacteriota bacterium]